MKTLALFSGGLDSTVLVAQLIKDGHDVTALSYEYGSMHEFAEMSAANRIARHFHLDRMVVQLPEKIFEGGSSALLGQSDMPEGKYHDVAKEGPSSTVVPFRNAIMISMAVAIANSRGFEQVAIANHASDSAHWAYPDCSPEFIGAMCSAVYAGTHHEVRLIAPFTWSTKADIVTIASRLYAPVQLTWSCYKGGEVACGTCPTCLERIEAFRTARFVDPIKYAIDVDWPRCCPWQLHLTY